MKKLPTELPLLQTQAKFSRVPRATLISDHLGTNLGLPSTTVRLNNLLDRCRTHWKLLSSWLCLLPGKDTLKSAKGRVAWGRIWEGSTHEVLMAGPLPMESRVVLPGPTYDVWHCWVLPTRAAHSSPGVQRYLTLHYLVSPLPMWWTEISSSLEVELFSTDTDPQSAITWSFWHCQPPPWVISLVWTLKGPTMRYHISTNYQFDARDPPWITRHSCHLGNCKDLEVACGEGGETKARPLFRWDQIPYYAKGKDLYTENYRTLLKEIKKT